MDGTSMMSRGYELRPARKVFLYRNGVTDTDPKCMIVNDRQIRDFSTFLNRATSGLRAPVAIRNIYTPAGGHKVRTLDDLQSGHYYVAGGSEHFKKVKYGSEGKRLLARRQRTELILSHRSPGHAIIASARYKRPIEKPFVIHVFRNGDERYRGARILIPRRMMGSWEYVLEMVTEKNGLITPAKRLCTLDGRLLHAVSELQDGGKYVALEGTKPFQKVSYSALEEKRSPLRVAATVTKAIRRRKKLPPRPRAAKQAHSEDEPVDPPDPSEVVNKVKERRKSRPFGGRKNKEGREKAIEDHKADSIFGGSPARPASPVEPLDPVQDSPITTHQVSKTLDTPVEVPQLASSPIEQTTTELEIEEEVVEDLSTSMPVEETLEQSTHEDKDESVKAPVDDTGDVEEVLEGGEAEGDKSIKTVEETEEVDEGQNYGKANEQALKELESQPLQNSVDLSVLKNKPLPSDEDHTQEDTSSRRNSAKSKQSSRKSSAIERTSRPQSVDKVNSSQAHSVLNVSRPESKSPQEQAKEPTPPPAEVPEEEDVQDETKAEPVEADPIQVEKEGTRSEESVEPTTEPAETKQTDIPDDDTESNKDNQDTPEETVDADTEEPTKMTMGFVVESTETQS